MKNSRRIALTGMMCALGCVVMMMGGLIPLNTYISPAIAGLALIPAFVEYGAKIALAGYGAIAILSLMLCPDKESAVLFVFLGYYPVLKWRLEQFRSRAVRIAAKLMVFNASVLVMYFFVLKLVGMDAVIEEYREMGMVLTGICLLLGNITMLLYDRMLGVMTHIYIHKFRSKLMK